MKSIPLLLEELKIPRVQSFFELEKSRSEEYVELLRKIMESLETQRNLAAEKILRDRAGYSHTAYPDWAYDVANIFVNTNQVYSHQVKQAVFDICSIMLQDYQTANHEFLQAVSDNEECSLLANIAKDLLPPTPHYNS